MSVDLSTLYTPRVCPKCREEFNVRTDRKIPETAQCGLCDPKGKTMARKPKNGTETKPEATETTADATHAPVVRHKFVQKLPCRVETPALLTMAEGMAQCAEELDLVEEERAEAMRGFKAKITGIKERSKELAKGIRSHTELRDVECIERLTANNEIEVVRTDTGEILETRPADAVDLQDDLFEDETKNSTHVEATPNEPGPGDVEDPDAVLAGETKWTTGPNPKPIQPEA